MEGREHRELGERKKAVSMIVVVRDREGSENPTDHERGGLGGPSVANHIVQCSLLSSHPCSIVFHIWTCDHCYAAKQTSAAQTNVHKVTPA